MQSLLDQISNNTTSFNVVAEAPSSESLATVDAAAASAELKTLLELTGASVYALDAQAGGTPPDAIFQVVGANPVSIGAARIATQVTFDVTLREKDYELLLALLAATETQVQAAAGAISITGAAAAFDEKTGLHMFGLELQYIVPAVAGAGSDYPAVLVDLTNVAAAGSTYDNTVKQRVTRNYGMTILSTSNNIAALRTELQGALLGWQEQATYFEMQYSSGASVDIGGGLYAWREQYEDGLFITQQ
ncbi:MAG: hypothetical protein AB9Q17_02315 [Candidatus Reddybacter sp.]